MSKPLEYKIMLKDGATAVLRGTLAGVRAFAHGVRGIFGGLVSVVGGFTRSLLSIPSLLAGSAVGGFITKAVSAFMTQEKATHDLAMALRLAGDASDDTLSRLVKLSGALQKFTTYGDEATQAAMAFGINMGVPADRIGDVTKAAMGLAKRTGMDLNTAMGLFGRTASGVSAMLSRYGIKIDETASPQERLNQLTREGIKYFGLAAAESGTLRGRWEQLKNVLGDFLEKVGEAIDKVFNLRGGFAALRDRVSDFINSVAGNDAIEKWVSRVKSALEDVIALFRVIFSGKPEERNTVFQSLGAVLGNMFAVAAVGAVKILMEAGPAIGWAIWHGFSGLLRAQAPRLALHLGIQREDPHMVAAKREKELADRFMRGEVLYDEFTGKEALSRYRYNDSTGDLLPEPTEAEVRGYIGHDPRVKTQSVQEIYTRINPEGKKLAGVLDRAEAALEASLEALSERVSAYRPDLRAPDVPDTPPPDVPTGPGHHAGGFNASGALQKRIDDYFFSKMSPEQQMDELNQRIEAFRFNEPTEESVAELLENLSKRAALKSQMEKPKKAGGLSSGSLEDLFAAQRAGGSRDVIRMRGSLASAFGRGIETGPDGVKRMRGSMASAFARSKADILDKHRAAEGEMAALGARFSGDNPEQETADNTYDMLKLLQEIRDNVKGVE
jgi:hypothetical protein